MQHWMCARSEPSGARKSDKCNRHPHLSHHLMRPQCGLREGSDQNLPGSGEIRMQGKRGVLVSRGGPWRMGGSRGSLLHARLCSKHHLCVHIFHPFKNHIKSIQLTFIQRKLTQREVTCQWAHSSSVVLLEFSARQSGCRVHAADCYPGHLGLGQVKMKRCDSQEVDGEAMVITAVDKSVWATLLSSWNPTLKGMIGP